MASQTRVALSRTGCALLACGVPDTDAADGKWKPKADIATGISRRRRRTGERRRPRRHLRIKNPGRISISHKDFSEAVGRRAYLETRGHVASRNRLLYYRVEERESVEVHTRHGHEFIASSSEGWLVGWLLACSVRSSCLPGDSANAIRRARAGRSADRENAFAKQHTWEKFAEGWNVRHISRGRPKTFPAALAHRRYYRMDSKVEQFPKRSENSRRAD